MPSLSSSSFDKSYDVIEPESRDLELHEVQKPPQVPSPTMELPSMDIDKENKESEADTTIQEEEAQELKAIVKEIVTKTTQELQGELVKSRVKEVAAASEMEIEKSPPRDIVKEKEIEKEQPTPAAATIESAAQQPKEYVSGANDETPMLVNYLITKLQQAMVNLALQGLSMAREGENPYQELCNLLLDDSHPSRGRGHAQREESPTKEKERSKSPTKSMEEDVFLGRHRAQRSPTPTKRKRSPRSPPYRQLKREEKTSKKKKRERGHPLIHLCHLLPPRMKVVAIPQGNHQGEGIEDHKLFNKLKKFKEGGKSISFLTYDGIFGATDKVLAFIQQFDAAFGDKGLTKSSKLHHVAMHLQKSAKQWWASLWANGEAPPTWKNLRASIMKQFLSSDAKDKVLTKWRSLKLTSFESIHKDSITQLEPLNVGNLIELDEDVLYEIVIRLPHCDWVELEGKELLVNCYFLTAFNIHKDVLFIQAACALRIVNQVQFITWNVVAFWDSKNEDLVISIHHLSFEGFQPFLELINGLPFCFDQTNRDLIEAWIANEENLNWYYLTYSFAGEWF
ncbi:hypothetical protein L7F22_054266 [Adiantum nelumboides]|nr:hypothetical protein [Adiantum nelumboides]